VGISLFPARAALLAAKAVKLLLGELVRIGDGKSLENGDGTEV
jgi:hypothetical protein